MSDRKFTPGPWRVDEGRAIVGRWEDGTEVQVCSMNSTHWSHPSGRGGPDPEVYRKNSRMSDESDNNARLIAAAPELYEALKNLVAATEAADNVRDMGVGSDEPVVDQALAALAKAEAPNE